jgi:hypothetical protein
MISIRTILSLVAVEDLHLEHLCKNSFSPWRFGGRDLYVAAIEIM